MLCFYIVSLQFDITLFGRSVMVRKRFLARTAAPPSWKIKNVSGETNQASTGVVDENSLPFWEKVLHSNGLSWGGVAVQEPPKSTTQQIRSHIPH